MDKRYTLALLFVVLLVSVFAPAKAQSGISSGLVSCWEMDEPGGPRADSVAYNHLTDNNTVNSITGLHSVAGDYIVANSEYLSIKTTSGPLLNPGNNGSFTVTTWVNLKSFAVRNPIYGKFNGISNIDFTLAAYLAGTDWYWTAKDSGGAPHNAIFADYNLGQWDFVAAYYDNAAAVIGASLNDGAVTTVSHTSLQNSGTDIWIGRDSGTYAAAYIDTTTYHNRVLSTVEITELYNGGAGLSCDEILYDGTGGGGVDDGSAIYTVDLPSGEVGTLKAQITTGDFVITTGLIGIGLVLGFDLMRKIVYGARHK